jgi:hypothetical protein
MILIGPALKAMDDFLSVYKKCTMNFGEMGISNSAHAHDLE